MAHGKATAFEDFTDQVGTKYVSIREKNREEHSTQ